jgi:hypothetical protein
MEQAMDIRKEGPFYDDTNYPRGFSKHGVFTINEASALHEYGRVLKKLALGELVAESDAEKHFVKVCQLKAKPKTYLEKLWLKYQHSIGARAVFFTLFSSSNHIVADDIEDQPEPFDDDEAAA